MGELFFECEKLITTFCFVMVSVGEWGLIKLTKKLKILKNQPFAASFLRLGGVVGVL